MIDRKTFAYLFVAAFISITYYFYANNDYIANIIISDGIKGMLFYFASNFSYVLIIFTIIVLNRESGVSNWRNILGGVLLIIAFDITSFPRFSPSGISTEISSLASSDGLFITKLTNIGFSYTNAWTFYYLILPILLIIASLQILGISNFTKKIFNNG